MAQGLLQQLEDLQLSERPDSSETSRDAWDQDEKLAASATAPIGGEFVITICPCNLDFRLWGMTLC